MTVRLTHQTKHFCMSTLAEDYYLRIRIVVVLTLYPTLQSQYNGARSVYYFYAVTTSQLISLWWLAMRTEQHLHILQFFHVVMVDGDKPLVVQALHLHAVMDDVAKAIEARALGKLLLRLTYCGSDSEAEATTLVYLNSQLSVHYERLI